MYKRCWGCNIDNIQIFSWLAGSYLCETCKKNIWSEEVSKNYKANMLLSEESGNLKKAEQKQINISSDAVSSFLLHLCLISFIIFTIFVIFSSFFEGKSEECIPRYLQEPTQSQLDKIKEEEANGVYGDRYILSRKVGCV